MQKIITLLRAVAMLFGLAIGWKVWQLYGPSNDQLRSLASRAVEIAQEALSSDSDPSQTAVDPRLAPVPAAPPDSSLGQSSSGVAPAAAELLPAEGLVEPARFEAEEQVTELAGDVRPLPKIDTPSNESRALSASDEKLQSMIARLQAFGVQEPQLKRWGSGGELHRFSCRVPWGEASTFTRHFESVAADPVAAVEAVAEEVNAWRLAQGGGAVVR